MIEVAVVPVRTLSSPAGRRGGGYRPWLEAAALVHVEVADWGHREDGWLHWAAPVRGGRVVLEEAGRAWPGRRAGWAGEPPEAQRRDAAPAGEAAVREAAAALWRGFRPVLFRHEKLGAVSSVGEEREPFRRRCMSGFGEAVRDGRLGRRDAAAVAGLADGIEARALSGGECRLVALQAGFAWYPEGTAPGPAAGDLMTGGGVRRPG